MCFRRRKKLTIDLSPKQGRKTKRELLITEKLINADDETLKNLAIKIKEGHPVIVNTAELELLEANKVHAFLSGIVFAIDGEIHQFRKEHNVLYGDKNTFNDETINELIKKIEG